MKTIDCCYKCSSRYLGCHSECEEYMSERQEYDNEKDIINKKRKESTDYKCHYIDKMEKIRKHIK